MFWKMNLIQLAILTFCINQSVGQENIRFDQSVKAPRHLTANRGPVKFTTNYVSRGKLIVDDTPDEFNIQKPARKDKHYDDFLSFLYRNDKTKSKVKRSIEVGATLNDNNDRSKRMLVFRPLFVYKQQEIKRQKVMNSKRKTPKSKPNKNQG